MNEKMNGIIFIVLGIVLAIIYLIWNVIPLYLYWIAVAILILYGIYLYLRA